MQSEEQAAGISSETVQAAGVPAFSPAKAPEGPVNGETASAHPDFNGDGFADLAIAVTCEDVGTVVDAGAVSVIYGSAVGLSATAGPGNQLWTQDSPGIRDVAEESDQFGHVLATGDFNGDGFDDLVVHSREDLGTLTDAGSVHVIYGSAGGLTSAHNQMWTQDTPGIKDVAEAGDLFGRALAAGDFDADGFADLAIGVPDEYIGLIPTAGVVHVLYGSPRGLRPTRNQLWSQNSGGILDSAERGDEFGRALATADFNGDGFADLSIGARRESLGEGPSRIGEAGAVNVIYGSPRGLSATAGPRNQFWTQDSPGIVDQAEPGDWFGRPLKTGDFNDDGFGDLAIGVFKEDINISDQGAVNVIYGGPSGLSATGGPGNQLWSQDSPGILDQGEFGDWFSRWDATGDFNNDGFDDLVLGAPAEDVGDGADRVLAAGALSIIYGSANGLTADAGLGNQFWHQDSPDVLDQVEEHDWFAHGDLAAADFNGDGFIDLAVGVIYEDLEGPPFIDSAGAVNVFHGSSSGISSAGNQFWTQDSPGILDEAEAFDVFGSTLGWTGDN